MLFKDSKEECIPRKVHIWYSLESKKMKDKVEKIVQGLPFTKWQQFAEKEKEIKSKNNRVGNDDDGVVPKYGMKTQNDGE